MTLNPVRALTLLSLPSVSSAALTRRFFSLSSGFPPCPCSHHTSKSASSVAVFRNVGLDLDVQLGPGLRLSA